MAAASIAFTSQPLSRREIVRWRRRSRLIRTLRILLPLMIGAILAGLAAQVVRHSVTTNVAAQSAEGPIRLSNPRFVGRDGLGRAFVLTAEAAVRDRSDFQRVILLRPAVVINEAAADATRLSAASGVYHEGTRRLQLAGGVRLASAQTAFDTVTSFYDTRSGELIGSGPIQGSGSLGEINAKSYGVYNEGGRLIFKGGVRARIDSE